MNYVRKLGFEETPDYDFLRELFSKVLKTLGEAEDGVFDWMLLNGGKGWEAGNVCIQPIRLVYLFKNPSRLRHPFLPKHMLLRRLRLHIENDGNETMGHIDELHGKFTTISHHQLRSSSVLPLTPRAVGQLEIGIIRTVTWPAAIKPLHLRAVV